jgi:hypothetical protein
MKEFGENIVAEFDASPPEETFVPRVSAPKDVDGLNSALDYIGSTLGQGIGSIAMVVGGAAAGAGVGAAGGAVVGAAGGGVGAIPAGAAGAVAGGATGGAIAGGFLLNYGDTYEYLMETEGMDPESAAEFALIPGLMMAGLDAWGVGKLLGPAKQALSANIIKRTGQLALRGAGTEGVTESAQQVIQESTGEIAEAAGYATEDIEFAQRAESILNSFVAGVLTGGAMGGATSPFKKGTEAPPAPTPGPAPTPVESAFTDDNIDVVTEVARPGFAYFTHSIGGGMMGRRMGLMGGLDTLGGGIADAGVLFDTRDTELGPSFRPFLHQLGFISEGDADGRSVADNLRKKLADRTPYLHDAPVSFLYELPIAPDADVQYQTVEMDGKTSVNMAGANKVIADASMRLGEPGTEAASTIAERILANRGVSRGRGLNSVLPSKYIRGVFVSGEFISLDDYRSRVQSRSGAPAAVESAPVEAAPEAQGFDTIEDYQAQLEVESLKVEEPAPEAVEEVEVEPAPPEGPVPVFESQAKKFIDGLPDKLSVQGLEGILGRKRHPKGGQVAKYTQDVKDKDTGKIIHKKGDKKLTKPKDPSVEPEEIIYPEFTYKNIVAGEWEALNLDDFIGAAKASGKKSISKEDLVRYVEENKVEVEDVMLGGKSKALDPERLERAQVELTDAHAGVERLYQEFAHALGKRAGDTATMYHRIKEDPFAIYDLIDPKLGDRAHIIQGASGRILDDFAGGPNAAAPPFDRMSLATRGPFSSYGEMQTFELRDMIMTNDRGADIGGMDRDELIEMAKSYDETEINDPTGFSSPGPDLLIDWYNRKRTEMLPDGTKSFLQPQDGAFLDEMYKDFFASAEIGINPNFGFDGINPESVKDYRSRLADITKRYSTGKDSDLPSVRSFLNRIEKFDDELRTTQVPGGLLAQRALVKEFGESPEFRRLVEARAEMLPASKGVEAARTRYEDYTLRGGTNYQEILLTIPKKPYVLTPVFKKWYKEPDQQHVPGKENLDFHGLTENEQDSFLREFQHSGPPGRAFEKRKPPFTESHHRDIPNVVVHIRTKDRLDIRGRLILFIEEIQSDWHQKGRSFGYKNKDGKNVEVFNSRTREVVARFATGKEAESYIGLNDPNFENLDYGELSSFDLDNMPPDAPFKRTEEWAGLAVRRILREAAEGGYHGVAFTRGKDASNVVSMPISSAEEFYDKILPSIVKKESKGKLGKTKISIGEAEIGDEQEFNFLELTPEVKARAMKSHKLFDETGGGLSEDRPLGIKNSTAEEFHAKINELKTGKEVAQFLVESAEDPSFQKLAERIIPHLDDVTVTAYGIGEKSPKSIASGDARGLTSIILKGSGATISLRGAGLGASGVNATTVLHELLHAATMRRLGDARIQANEDTQLQNALIDLGSLTTLVHEGRREIQKQFESEGREFGDYINDIPGPISMDTDEVLAWGLTDKKFQDFLRTIKIGNETAFSKFVRIIMDLLGIPESERNGLTEIIRITDEVLNAPLDELKVRRQTLGGDPESVSPVAEQFEETDQPPAAANPLDPDIAQIRADPSASQSVLETLDVMDDLESGRKQLREGMRHLDLASYIRNMRKAAVDEYLESSAKPPAAAAESDDYRVSHQPSKGPSGDEIGTTDDFPKDILQHPEWYTGYPKEATKFWPKIVAGSGNPDAKITIYRAMPKDAGSTIENGNWVTPSKAYAEDHAEGEEGWHIVAVEVPLRDINWAGDDLMEWGYWGSSTKPPPATGLSEVERAQLGTPKGGRSDFDYISEENWPILREMLVRNRAGKKTYKQTETFGPLDPELTAYTPGETLKLLSHPKIVDWHNKVSNYKIPDEYETVVLVPCATSKPWGAAACGGAYYPAYNKILKEVESGEIPGPVFFATISEPLGIVPMDMWGEFPAYDNPGLFNDDPMRSGMETKDWNASQFGQKYMLPFDQEAKDKSIDILGDVVANFVDNNQSSGRQFMSFVDVKDMNPKKPTTHALMLERAEKTLDREIVSPTARFGKGPNVGGQPKWPRIYDHIRKILSTKGIGIGAAALPAAGALMADDDDLLQSSMRE